MSTAAPTAPSPVPRPTVCRVVLYACGKEPRAAIVTEVKDATMEVSLHVFHLPRDFAGFVGPFSFHHENVQYDAQGSLGTWSWPTVPASALRSAVEGKNSTDIAGIQAAIAALGARLDGLDAQDKSLIAALSALNTPTPVTQTV